MTNCEAMQIAAKEGFVRLYEIGKADGKAEAILNQCNHDEAVKMAFERGRADAIEQILEQMIAYRDAHYYSFANYDVQKYADGFKNATNTLISMVEQLKENKNDIR